ncbi:MAG: recombinase family protein [Chloroflexota bacterium]|nr:recombinase family protein [Chloroflexota bacterium]MDE2941301.1 recombinase family protein [Chloroflexota bacterium]MDE3267767.1 recombinase family protein [Chloroflexota bacterium]
MRAIGYFSAPAGSGAETALLEQQEAFDSYCRRNRHQTVATFTEDSPNGDRSGFEEMLNHMRSSGSEFLVVLPDAQYVGDNMESVVRRVLELDALRAKVVCSDDDMPDPLQQALRHWRKGGVRGDRIRSAMMNKALRGEGLGKPPYGYAIGSDGRLEVVPEESEAVRLIYRMYNRGGVGLRRIVRSLNEKGVPTRGGRGWSLVTVRDVLRNRSYLGTYTRFGLRVPANHPAIIDREEFRLAQEKMEQGRTRRRASYPSEPFLLSGLAYCANCGNRMMGVSRRQGWRRKDGTRSVGQYRYYQCQSRANQGTCGYHTWRAGDLEQTVLRETREALERGDLAIDPAAYLALEASSNGDGLQSDARFMRELESTASGMTSLDRLRSVLAELDEEKAGAGGSLPEAVRDALESGDATVLLREWDTLEGAAAGRVLRALVSRVDVSDGSVEVTAVTGVSGSL